MGRHHWFEQFEREDAVMRFFLEPVVSAARFAKERLGYAHVVLMGLSGGGWTVTLAAAMLPRHANLTIEVAGSVPKWPTAGWPHWVADLPEAHHKRFHSKHIERDADHGAVGDYEATKPRGVYAAVGGFAQLYVLGAMERGRARLQILHENDECCYRALEQHAAIHGYNRYVQARVEGWAQTAVTAGKHHMVNQHDLALAVLAIEALRAGEIADWRPDKQLPHNLLVLPTT